MTIVCRVAVRDARADILPLVAQSSKKVGPGDPAAHRTNRLPLLPSGPGGVHRVLLHRARPRGVCDSTGATGERGWYEASLTITSSQATPDASHLQHGGEGGHSKSRLRAPTEGACPLVSPHAGECLPRDPPRSNPTASVHDGDSTRTFCQSYMHFWMAERVGFEPTVPFRTTVFETVRFGRSRTSPFLGRQGHAAYPDESQDSTKNHEVGRNFFHQ